MIDAKGISTVVDYVGQQFVIFRDVAVEECRTVNLEIIKQRKEQGAFLTDIAEFKFETLTGAYTG